MLELLICPIANPWAPAKDGNDVGHGVNGVLVAFVPIHVLLLPGMGTGIGLFSKFKKMLVVVCVISV